jgi:voltage-gated potassium channel Kch
MSLDLNVLSAKPHLILLYTVIFMSIKSLMIYGLGRLFKFPNESARNMAFTLPQGGEFAFVLFSAALYQGILSSEMSSILNASVTVSMVLTPFLFSLNQKYLRSYSEISEKPYDHIESENAEVIIAGFGRFGQIVSRFLYIEDVSFTILDHSASQVETARNFGSKVYYGDASRADILESAGAKDAKVFVLAIDNIEKSIETAKMVKEHFPHLEIIARARNRQHAHLLMQLGVTNFHRETYLTSLEVAKEVLLFGGKDREYINKRLAKFRTHDEEVLREQFKHFEDRKKFISFTMEATQQLQNTLKADKEV